MLALGGYGYYAHGRIEQLTQDVSTFKTAAQNNLKAKEDADRSCVVTVDTLNSYYREQEGIQTSQEATGAAILALPTLTIKEKAHAAPTKPQGFADDDRLSPDLMQLLDKAYCDGNKDGCSTPAK
jgi:hypothetical protein